MTIKSKNTSGVIRLIVGDNIIHTVAGKIGVEALNCFNPTGVDINVKFFVSPDDTSAGGEQVDEVIISAKSETDINSVIGQGYADSSRIIAVVTVADVTASMTYTQFTGNDA